MKAIAFKTNALSGPRQFGAALLLIAAFAPVAAQAQGVNDAPRGGAPTYPYPYQYNGGTNDGGGQGAINRGRIYGERRMYQPRSQRAPIYRYRTNTYRY